MSSAVASITALLVEDDLATRLLITEHLSERGATVQAVASVEDAIDVLDAIARHIDIVVLDLDLPDAAGMQALDALLSATEVPVVVHSTILDDEQTAIARRLGAAGVVPKDDGLEVLAAALDLVLWPTPNIDAGEVDGTVAVEDTTANRSILRTLDFLAGTVPMGKWLFTQVRGDDWIVLAVAGNDYPQVVPGVVKRWSASYCSRMLAGEGPSVAGDVSTVPAYVTAPINAELDIGSYCAAPIEAPGVGLFGTLCGIAPDTQQLDGSSVERIVRFAAQHLSHDVARDAELTRLRRRLDVIEAEAFRDPLTGIGNEQGLQVMLQVESHRAAAEGKSVAIAVARHDGAIEGRLGWVRTVSRALAPFAAVFRAGDDELVAVARRQGTRMVTTGMESSDPTFDIRLRTAMAEAGLAVAMGTAVQASPSQALGEVLAEARRRLPDRT